MTSLKILLVAYVTTGGEWSAVLNLVRAVKKFTPHVSFALIGFGQEPPQEGYPFVKTLFIRQADCLPPFSFFRKLWKDFFRLRQAIKSVSRSYSPDYILVTHYLASLSLLSFSLRMTIKSFFLFHGTKGALRLEGRERNYREFCVLILERLALLLNNSVITPSYAGELLIRSMLGIFGKKKNIYIVPNCYEDIFLNAHTDNSSIDRFSIRKKSSQHTILYCGRIAKYKGLERLLDAFKIYAALDGNVVLYIVAPSGNPDDQVLYSLQTKMRDEQINNKVFFLYDVSRKMMPQLYKASSVMVLPSELEISPLVILESLLCTTPCIATRVGNIPEMLSQVDNALLMENNTSQEIVKKLDYFFHIPNSRLTTMKKICREVALKYTPEKAARIFLETISRHV